MTEQRCTLCGEPIPDGEHPYIGVVGWEKPHHGIGGKSGSSIVLRRPTGEVACHACITARRAGLHREQLSLE